MHPNLCYTAQAIGERARGRTAAGSSSARQIIQIRFEVGTMQAEAVSTRLTIRIEGVFDVPAARRVCELLGAAPDGESVSLDLSKVREFQDPGVAVLAEALAGPGASRVAVRGLRQHQLRMLRYLGVSPESIGVPEAMPIERV